MANVQKDERPESSVTASSLQSIQSETMQYLESKEKYIEKFDFIYCDESSKYEKVAKIGQGTFGYILTLVISNQMMFQLEQFLFQ